MPPRSKALDERSSIAGTVKDMDTLPCIKGEALAAFKARQSAKGQKGGKIGMLNRWGDNEDKKASARIMAAKGMAIKTIAEELGVHRNTVSLWLKSES